MIFANRVTAARQLAAALSEYRDKHPLVLAIPRGAVPMAKIIADRTERRNGCGAGAQVARTR